LGNEQSDLKSCALVIPCYNEALRLQSETFIDFAQNYPNIHFVFVNDGSRDNTSAVLKALASRIPSQSTVLDNAVNQGKAGVVRQGVLYAIDSLSAEAIGFWDADLATPLPAAVDMLKVLEATPNLWMIFGARVQLLGRHIDRKPHRHYLGRVFATCVSVLLKLPIYDTQCGAKIFRRTPPLRRLFEEPFVSRWIFDVEIIARFMKLPAGSTPRPEDAIYEYDLMSWRDVDGSKVKPLDFFKALGDLYRIFGR
jgi:dolichyl-phosphate beta-glucosyltransferase